MGHFMTRRDQVDPLENSPLRRSFTLENSMKIARLLTTSVLIVCWTETLQAGDIVQINLNGTNPVTLVSNISGSLVELDLDLPDNKMYWMTSVGIFNANLNGSNVQEILPVGPLTTLVKDDMIITPNLIVWTENGSIFRANLDGSGKQEIFQASASTGAASNLAPKQA